MQQCQWATPTFCNCTLVSASVWKPHSCFVCACTQKIRPFIGLHRATPINRLQLQVPGVLLPLHYVSFTLYIACTLDLCKATPTFLKYILVPVNLLEPPTVLCTIPTNSLLHFLVIVGICKLCNFACMCKGLSLLNLHTMPVYNVKHAEHKPSLF